MVVMVPVSAPHTQQDVFDGLFADIHRRKHQIHGLGEHEYGFYPRIPASPSASLLSMENGNVKLTHMVVVSSPFSEFHYPASQEGHSLNQAQTHQTRPNNPDPCTLESLFAGRIPTTTHPR